MKLNSIQMVELKYYYSINKKINKNMSFVNEIPKINSFLNESIIYSDNKSTIDRFYNEAEKLCIDNGIRPSKNIEVLILDIDTVIGCLLIDSGYIYSFDIVIHEKYRGLGLVNDLVKYAVSKYNSLREDNPEYEMQIEVVNPTMVDILVNKFNFKIENTIGNIKILTPNF